MRCARRVFCSWVRPRAWRVPRSCSAASIRSSASSSAARSWPGASMSSRPPRALRRDWSGSAGRRSERVIGSSRSALLTALERLLLDQFTPAWVIINAEGECLYFSNRTGKYLEPAAGLPSAEIVNMARPGLRLDLRAAIHKSVKTNQPVTHENVVVETNGDIQRIDLMVRPMTELSGTSQLYLVVFKEQGAPRSRAEAAAEGAVLRTGDAIVQQLESELRTMKEHLQRSEERRVGKGGR